MAGRRIAAATPVEEGLPPPSSSHQQQLTTAETTGLLGSGAADDGDPAAAAATEPRLPRLLVRQITGEQTALHLDLDDTIGSLKEALRVEWGIEADAQRLLLANSAAAGGDAETGGGGGLPLEEDEVATLRACGLADGAELLLTLQDAAQGAARRELREAARREAAERAEAERQLAAERAELSALRGDAREKRWRALKRKRARWLTEPQREFVSREAERKLAPAREQAARREAVARRDARQERCLAFGLLVLLLAFLALVVGSVCDHHLSLDLPKCNAFEDLSDSDSGSGSAWS
jgi:hypothetical protein